VRHRRARASGPAHPVEGGYGDADTHREGKRGGGSSNDKRLTSYRDTQALGDCCGKCQFRLGHYYDEFLAPEAGDEVGVAHAVDRAGRDLAQHVITSGMAVAVFDSLKMVYVEQQKRDANSIAICPFDQLVEMGKR
jgi:hypothetical protein